MKFVYYLKKFEGKWVSVWTPDSPVDDDNTQLIFFGKMTVQDDFIELINRRGNVTVIPLSYVVAVTDDWDQEYCEALHQEWVREQEILGKMERQL